MQPTWSASLWENAHYCSKPKFYWPYDQYWETTLDPSNRSLLRVEAEQADVAHEIFERLMGDEVEPRRDFIQANALNVANLDV